MKNLDEKELLEELRRVPWDSLYIFEDVDDLWDLWACKGLLPGVGQTRSSKENAD